MHYVNILLLFIDNIIISLGPGPYIDITKYIEYIRPGDPISIIVDQ